MLQTIRAIVSDPANQATPGWIGGGAIVTKLVQWSPDMVPWRGHLASFDDDLARLAGD